MKLQLSLQFYLNENVRSNMSNPPISQNITDILLQVVHFPVNLKSDNLGILDDHYSENDGC